MCGIAGTWSANGGAPDAAGRDVRRMLAAIRHRGPDGEGVATHGGAAIGAVRLAVLDPEHGAQPMWTTDGRFCVALNGEVVNHVELRARLEAQGARFRTRCDTEVVLELLAREGEAGLARLDGMFALAFLDTESAELLLARDPCGIKPLYWREDGDRIVFASEQKALLAIAAAPVLLDEGALLDYLAFQVPLGERTFHAGIRRLAPGTTLRLAPGREPIVGALPAWHAPPEVPATAAEAAEVLGTLLRDSIVRHLRSDVALGAHLSGGMDSSLVAAVASGALGGALHVFTGAFDVPGFDERRHALAVASEIGAVPHEIVPEPAEIAEALVAASVAMDEPMAGPGLLPQWCVSRRAAQHVKVVLGGQGGDELFAGYVRHVIVGMAESVRAGGGSRERELAAHADVLSGYGPLLARFGDAGWKSDAADACFRLHYRGDGVEGALSGDLRAAFRRHPARERFRARFDEACRGTAVERTAMGDAARFDRAVVLPALLHVEDRTSMAWSLESRVPLLGREVLSFMERVPDRMLAEDGRPKSLLRRAVSRDLPEAARVRRDKMGFPVPLAAWARGPLSDFVRDLLLDGTARSRGLFDPAAVETVLAGESIDGRQLWALLNVELWMRNNAA